ncbi:MAG: 5'-3' exonuclease H3TH domain-containing protein, partial [Alphaproteobacteria bacterium]
MTSQISAQEKEMNDTNEDGELYLVDGSGFIFRAYFAMAYSRQKTMTNPAGVPVNAVFGFTQMLLKLLNDYHAPYMAVIFDAARHNFRNDIYENYKANRDDPPEDLIPQFKLVRDATQAFDIPALEMEGYEADDLIATYTRLAKAQGKKVVIVSSDKDLMQLIDDDVRMLDPMKGKFMEEKDVLDKFGVTPDKVVDVQSLAGDSIDNVPGVPGIGIKTAAQLINEFGSLEELLERAEEIKQNKRRESLINHREDALISKQLVRLDDNVPVAIPLEEFKTHDPEKPRLMEFLKEHAFNSIITRLGGEPVATASNDDNMGGAEEKLPPIAENKYVLINEIKILQEWMAQARAEGVLAIDTETTSLTPAKADLVGISIAIKPGKAAYIPIGHKTMQADLLGESSGEDIPQLSLSNVIEIMKPVLEDDSVLKIGHNMKYDWQILKLAGMEMKGMDDTMLLSYVLDGTSYSNGMDNLSAQWLGHAPIKY